MKGSAQQETRVVSYGARRPPIQVGVLRQVVLGNHPANLEENQSDAPRDFFAKELGSLHFQQNNTGPRKIELFRFRAPSEGPLRQVRRQEFICLASGFPRTYNYG